MKKSDYQVGGLIILVIVLIIGFIFYMWPQWKTEQRVLDVAYVCQLVEDPEVLVQNNQDAWDRDYVLETETGDAYVVYTVISSGRDGKFDTKDDIVGSEIDWNKSRIVGQWIGRKTKEVVVGIAEGVKEESKFENTEEKAEGIPAWEKFKSKFEKEE